MLCNLFVMNMRARVAGAVTIAAVAMTGAVVAIAASGSIDSPATSGQPARRVDPGLGDVVAIFDQQEVDAAVVQATFRVAEAAGGAAATARSGSQGMVRIARDGATVHAAPDGYLIPMVYLGLPSAAVAGLVGQDVSAMLGAGTVVMNELTAGQTGARVGDTIELVAANGSVQGYTIAGIRPHAVVGGSELVMTTEAVERIGAFDDTRTVIWGISSRAALDAAVAAEGLEDRRDTQVSRSWAPEEPDSSLSTARTKALLGEPWYRELDDSTLAMHPTWMATNLTDGRVLLNDAIPVRARCHVKIVDDLRAALAEVAAAGLGAAIEVANTNTYGGCFNPRYSRISGFLSRHAYGMAIDMNTVSNCQGCVPRMNCDVVRIFRKHGFAWGGNFRTPDGMHFEWVGEPRDQVAVTPKYCPNMVAGAADRTVGSDVTARNPATERGREVLVDGIDLFGQVDVH